MSLGEAQVILAATRIVREKVAQADELAWERAEAAFMKYHREMEEYRLEKWRFNLMVDNLQEAAARKVLPPKKPKQPEYRRGQFMTDLFSYIPVHKSSVVKPVPMATPADVSSLATAEVLTEVDAFAMHVQESQKSFSSY